MAKLTFPPTPQWMLPQKACTAALQPCQARSDERPIGTQAAGDERHSSGQVKGTFSGQAAGDERHISGQAAAELTS